MARVLVMADLHLDMWHARRLDPLADVDLTGLDALLIAGDLSNKAYVRWRPLLEQIRDRMDGGRILVGPGNHEPYQGDIDREDKLQEAAEAAGAEFIQKSDIRINGKRFLFCTLWTDMELGGNGYLNRLRLADKMNDFRKIRIASEGYRRLSPAHACALHADHRGWLEAQLKTPFEGDTVVVTHHAPHQYSLKDCGSGEYDAAYASDLSGIMLDHAPALWLHGHTHHPADYRIGDTRVLGVSLGYPPEPAQRYGATPEPPPGDPLAGLLAWEGDGPVVVGRDALVADPDAAEPGP